MGGGRARLCAEWLQRRSRAYQSTWLPSLSMRCLTVCIVSIALGFGLQVHPTRLKVRARGEVLLEGDFGGRQVGIDGAQRMQNFCAMTVGLPAADCMLGVPGCFWSLETEGDEKFIEVTLNKAGGGEWTQVCETVSSYSGRDAVPSPACRRHLHAAVNMWTSDHVTDSLCRRSLLMGKQCPQTTYAPPYSPTWTSRRVNAHAVSLLLQLQIIFAGVRIKLTVCWGRLHLLKGHKTEYWLIGALCRWRATWSGHLWALWRRSTKNSRELQSAFDWREGESLAHETRHLAPDASGACVGQMFLAELCQGSQVSVMRVCWQSTKRSLRKATRCCREMPQMASRCTTRAAPSTGSSQVQRSATL